MNAPETIFPYPTDLSNISGYDTGQYENTLRKMLSTAASWLPSIPKKPNPSPAGRSRRNLLRNCYRYYPAQPSPLARPPLSGLPSGSTLQP